MKHLDFTLANLEMKTIKKIAGECLLKESIKLSIHIAWNVLNKATLMKIGSLFYLMNKTY